MIKLNKVRSTLENLNSGSLAEPDIIPVEDDSNAKNGLKNIKKNKQQQIKHKTWKTEHEQKHEQTIKHEKQ